MSNIANAPQTIRESFSFVNKNETNSPPRSEKTNIAIVVPNGCKIRDEFVCPITRELITDPVIAADGHTYDRAAIEQWIHGPPCTNRPAAGNVTQKRSPKTGKILEHTILIPNHNLKTLLKDMIQEGGEALYLREGGSPTNSAVNERSGNNLNSTRPQNILPTKAYNSNKMNYDLNSPSAGPRIALVHAKILQCRCLGPPESDWNNRSFYLKESPAEKLLGGRRRPHEHTAQNFVQFTDATVSRRHFEIRFHDKTFQIRDLGSAGGTFVRIPPRVAVPLKEGTMIMLGKHQLVALECLANSIEEKGREEQADKSYEIEMRRRRSDLTSDVMNVDTLGFDLIEGFNRVSVDDDDVENDNVQAEDKSENTDNSGCQSNVIDESDKGSELSPTRRNSMEHGDNSPSENPLPETTNSETNETSQISGSLNLQNQIQNETPVAPSANQSNESSSPLLFLRCFAPEGTPIQNRKFPITQMGATLGRKQSNTISFCHPVVRDDSAREQSYVGIDSSISGEHATIKYNNETETLELFDGVDRRVSTNGTWIRLSPMHEESEWFSLDNKSEILIGTVRFQIVIEDGVIEKDLYD